MPHIFGKKTWGAWLLGLVLFALFAFRYWMTAIGKPFWTDEAGGIYHTMDRPWRQLFLEGSPPGQANKSPLFYVFDKIWFELWNYEPQLLWNLRVFFRIPPATFWALASVSVFAALVLKFQRYLPKLRPWQNLLLATGITMFFYDHSFMHMYAVEARSYALWVAVTTWHFLLLWERLETGFSRRSAIAFWLACVGLAATTYAAVLQVAAGFAGVLARDLLRRKRLEPLRTYRVDIISLVSATAVGVYYYLHYEGVRYIPAPLEIYFVSVREIVLKSFHHHGWQPGLVTVPLAFFLVPYWLRRNPEILSMYCFVWMNLLLTLVMYILARISGGIYHSRYAIFLIPAMTWAYFAMFAFLLSRLHKLLEKYLPRKFLPTFAALLLALASAQIFGSVRRIARDIGAVWTTTERGKIYGPTPRPEQCPREYTTDPETFETMNQLCR